MDMIRELGLGFLLKFTDQTSREVASARGHIQGLRTDTEGLTKSFGTQVTQLGTHAGNLAGLVKAGFAAFGGAAALMPVKAIIKEALESERQLRDLMTVTMAQGFPGEVATEKVSEAQRRIHEVNRQVPGMLDKMESAAGDMRGAFKGVYLDAFEPIAKLAFIGTQTGDFAQAMQVAATSLYQFRNSLPGKTDEEKIWAIADAFAKAKSYKLDIGETGDILVRAAKNASIYGADFYDMLSAIAPIARQTAMPRMAAAAVQQTYEALAAYPDLVKEMKKQPAKKGQAITWGDILGLNPQETEAIPAKSKWLLNLKVTTPAGMLKPLADIVDQVTAGLRVSQQQQADYIQMLKEGQTPEEAAKKGLGIDVTTAGLIMKLLGPSFGMYLGHADEMRQARAEFVASAGLTQSIFKTEVEQAAAQATLLGGQFSGLKDQIGDELTPALNFFLKALNDAAGGLGRWMEKNPKGATAASWIGTGAMIGTATAGSIYGVKKGSKAIKGLLGRTGGQVAGGVLSEVDLATLKSVLGEQSPIVDQFGRPLMKSTAEIITGGLGKIPSKLEKTLQLAFGENLGGAIFKSGAFGKSIGAKLAGTGFGALKAGGAFVSNPWAVFAQEILSSADIGKQSLSELGLQNQFIGPPTAEVSNALAMADVFGGTAREYPNGAFPLSVSLMSQVDLLDQISDKATLAQSAVSALLNMKTEQLSGMDLLRSSWMENLDADSSFSRPKTSDEKRTDLLRGMPAESTAARTQSLAGEPADVRTIYQSNYFTFLEATSDTAEKAATIIDKRARQKVERGAEGKR